MSEEFTDNKKIELLKDAIKDLHKGVLTPDSFAVVVCNIVDPLPITQKQMEWAIQEVKELRENHLL
jgi:hypothetical protein